MNVGREEGFEVGAVFGAWRVEALIGEEADAVLASVGRVDDGTRGVLKLVRTASAKKGDTAARFAREARALRAVAHAHVVPILDSGRMDDGRPWLVHAQIAGETLREALAARGKLPPGEAWRLARALLEALAVLHSLGVVHRNIAPGQILLEPREGRLEPRLFGFGFRLSPRALQDSPHAAPELRLGGGVDARADLFSLGVTLTEMLAGPTVRPSDLQTAPPPVSAFVARLTAADPIGRFANAWAAREAGDEAFAACAAADEIEAVELESIEAPLPNPLFQPAPAEIAPPPPPIELDLGAAATPFPQAPSAPLAAPAPIAEPAPDRPARPRSAPQSVREELYLPRYFATHAAIVAAGLLAPIAMGYAGASPRNVAGWFSAGGLSMVPIALAFLAAGVVIPRIGQKRAMGVESGHRAFAVAFAPVLLSTTGAGSAWTRLRETLTSLSPMDAFTALLSGSPGALVPRFWGFALGSAAFLMVLAMPLRRFRDRRFAPWRGADVAALVLGSGAMAGLWMGAASGAFVAAVGATACWLGRGLSFLPTSGRFREATDHAIASVAATILATGAAVTRLDARTAGPFLDAAATRADRALAIASASAERSSSGLLAALTLAVVVGMAVVRLARIRARMDGVVMPRSSAVLLLALPAFFALDLAIGAALPARRASLAAELAPQLVLLAALDPPGARAGPGTYESAPTPDVRVLQLTSSSIAIDGLALAREDALDSPIAREMLVAAIARATSNSPPAAALPDLALAADRRAKWTQVRELLRLARQAGARRVEVLLTRGGETPISPGRTPESAATLRSDFVAFPIEIGVAGDGEWTGTFADVVLEWQADASSGAPIVVGVGW